MFDLDEKRPENYKKNRGPDGFDKNKLIMAAVAVLVVVVIILAAALFLGRGKKEQTGPDPTISSELLKGQLQAIEELGTAAYYYTGVGKFENQNEFFGWKIPFTDKSFIITYDGEIKAGIDLGGVEVDVNESRKSISVTLPKAEVLSHEIFEDSIQVLDESSGLFNSITIEDYVGFSSEQKENMEQKVLDGGLLTEAEDNACKTVESMLSLVPGIEEYLVTVRVSSK